MEINAIYVKSTSEILYSREKHDRVLSEDESVGIDGGFEYVSVTGDFDNIIPLKLSGDKLLRQILYYDWRYGNRNADEFPNGYHGRLKIVTSSNIEFYEELIINFDDIKDEFTNVTNKRKKFTVLENPEPITMDDIECVRDLLKNILK